MASPCILVKLFNARSPVFCQKIPQYLSMRMGNDLSFRRPNGHYVSPAAQDIDQLGVRRLTGTFPELTRTAA
jgi:hypothetical protein